MTRPLKRSFTLLFTTLVGSLLLLNPLTAYAADHDLRIATELYNQRPGSAKVDITTDYYDKLLNNLNPYDANDPDRNRAAFERDYKKAQEQGTIAIVQDASISSSGAPYGHVRLYFNYSRNCEISLVRDNVGYFLRNNTNSADCSFRFAAFDADPIANYFGNSSAGLLYRFFISRSSSDSSSSLYMYTGDYTIDASAKGAPKLPNGEPKPEAGSSSIEWGDGCSLDIGCHFGNIGNFIKGFFDFSENNSFIRLFKFLVFPDNVAELLNFSDLADAFKVHLKVVFDAVDLLRSLFDALSAPVNYWSTSNYCTTSLVGDAGNQDSAGHNYILKATFFGHEFKPDVCSFERAIGGHRAMTTVRSFTSFALIVTSLFIWYFFLNRILGERL